MVKLKKKYFMKIPYTVNLTVYTAFLGIFSLRLLEFIENGMEKSTNYIRSI